MASSLFAIRISEPTGIHAVLPSDPERRYSIDTHERVEAFVKNAGLGFAIPYFDNGQTHEYVPDFLIRIKSMRPAMLILARIFHAN